MSRAGKAFELGGLVVPLTAALGHNQAISIAGGRSRLRFSNGAQVQQEAWRKLRIAISGTGWVPLGLDDLDFTATMVFKAGAPHGLRGNGNVVTLPAARRSDSGYEPFARAHLASGTEVPVAISLTGNVATCSIAAGAVSYTVGYYPQLTVWADPPEHQFDRSGAASSWELVLEEA